MNGLDGMEWHQCCQGTIPLAPTLPERQPKPNCRAQHPPEGQGAELRIVYQPHDSIAHDQKQHGAGAAGERGGAQQHGGGAGWVDRVVGGQAHPALQQVGGHHCSVQDPAGAMEDWPALHRWGDPSFLVSVAGPRTVPVEVGCGCIRCTPAGCVIAALHCPLLRVCVSSLCSRP